MHKNAILKFSGLRMAGCCLILAVLSMMGNACQKEETSQRAQATPVPLAESGIQRRMLTGKIVFQSTLNIYWDIYVMRADGTHIRQLTFNSANDEAPAWSPDGQQIAFKSDRDGNFDIYVMNADGTQQRNLTQYPARDEDPVWSPDGKQIAFYSDRQNGTEIYIMDSDGTHVRQITDTFGRNGLPAWSPDGTYLAYTGKRSVGWSLYVRHLETRKENRITAGCRPDWSPDGKTLAYVSSQFDQKGDICLIQPDGSGQQRLTSDDGSYEYFPAWSPDGRYIVYSKTAAEPLGNWNIHVMTADGKYDFQLTDYPAREKSPDWTQ